MKSARNHCFSLQIQVQICLVFDWEHIHETKETQFGIFFMEGEEEVGVLTAFGHDFFVFCFVYLLRKVHWSSTNHWLTRISHCSPKRTFSLPFHSCLLQNTCPEIIAVYFIFKWPNYPESFTRQTPRIDINVPF